MGILILNRMKSRALMFRILKAITGLALLEISAKRMHWRLMALQI